MPVRSCTQSTRGSQLSDYHVLAAASSAVSYGSAGTKSNKALNFVTSVWQLKVIFHGSSRPAVYGLRRIAKAALRNNDRPNVLVIGILANPGVTSCVNTCTILATAPSLTANRAIVRPGIHLPCTL